MAIKLTLISRLGCTVVFVGLLIGCSDSSQGGTKIEQITGVPIDLEVRQRFEQEYFSRTEEAVAECMAKAGFEYLPRLQPSTRPMPFTGEAPVAFGITDALLARISGSQQSRSTADPNLSILRSLTESERAAYGAVLEGLPAIRSDATADEVFELMRLGSQTGEGCRSISRASVDLAMGVDRSAVIALERALVDIRDDHRIVAAQFEWSECVAGMGYDFRNDGEMLESISNAGFDILIQASGRGSGRVDTPETLAALDTVLEDEIELFDANLECSIALDAVVETVRLEEIESFALSYKSD